MDPMYVVFTLIGTILVMLFSVLLQGVVLYRLNRVEEKLDRKTDKANCIREVAKQSNEFGELWQAVNKHSHSGLPGDSRVIR